MGERSVQNGSPEACKWFRGGVEDRLGEMISMSVFSPGKFPRSLLATTRATTTSAASLSGFPL
eukprot:3098801-Pyramimonas_sp.AAC.1